MRHAIHMTDTTHTLHTSISAEISVPITLHSLTFLSINYAVEVMSAGNEDWKVFKARHHRGRVPHSEQNSLIHVRGGMCSTVVTREP